MCEPKIAACCVDKPASRAAPSAAEKSARACESEARRGKMKVPAYSTGGGYVST